MTILQAIIELSKILGQVGIFAIAAYWIQKRIDTESSKRLEEFKSTLNLIYSKENTLHGKRLAVIETMYQNLIDLDYSMRTLTHPLKYSDRESELIDNSDVAFQRFNMFFEKSKIYFSEQTCQLISGIRDKFYNGLFDYSQPSFLKSMNVNDPDSLKEAYKKAHAVYKQVKDEIPQLRLTLENDFRKILSVS
jgi:hypothetical protein